MPSRTLPEPRMERTARIRVLIADPDECRLAAFRNSFQDDFDLDTASCGLECIARLRERTPDILVLEPQLPWGGGDGVLALMRADSTLALIPVMIVTSCRDIRLLTCIAPFRISDYSVKSVDAAELAKRIRNVVRHQLTREQRVEGAATLLEQQAAQVTVMKRKADIAPPAPTFGTVP